MDRKILLLVLVFLVPTLPVYAISSPVSSPQIQNIVSFHSTGLVSNPINITGNAELAVRASSGDGSNGNPYIIENYSIECTSNVAGIRIVHTDKYFILRNIAISHCLDGVYFDNVTFGSIVNSFATNNTYSGFDVWFSTTTTLLDNVAANNSGYGFNLWFSSTTALVSNTAARNNFEGFELVNSSSNSFTNNTATNNNDNGFDVQSFSNNNILISNAAINNHDIGFFLASSSNNILKGNIGQTNYKYDYFSYNCSNITLINNTFMKSNITSPSTPSFGYVGMFGALSLLILVKRKK